MLRDKTMDDKLTYIQVITQITPSEDYNYWLKRFDTSVLEPTKKI